MSSGSSDRAGAQTARHVIARGASGLRHLRWAREVLGTLSAFGAHEGLFTEAQRGALREEIERVTGLVRELSGAVKPYRDFKERVRTLARGKLRAADFVGEPAIVEAARDEMARAIEPERRELAAALAGAIDAARAGLASMDERLSAAFSPAFVAALYPELTADSMQVRDDEDPDDDASSAGP